MSDTSPGALRFDHAPDLDVQFPPLPKTVAEVSALLAARAEVPDTPRLVDIVNVDPVIATSVLRRVNSAYYGVRRRVGNLRQAVFMLGFEEVCNLVLTAAMLRLQDVLISDEQTRIFEQLMQTSTSTAYFSQLLADELDLFAKNAAFAAGLLHNVGRLVFLYNAPDTYEALWYIKDDGEMPRLHDEQRIFGLDHGQLGAEAGAEWNLPDEIIMAIRHYSTPRLVKEAYLKPFVYVVGVAASAGSQLVRYDTSSRDRWRFIPPTTLRALEQEVHLSPGAIVDLIEAHYNEALEYVHLTTKG